MPATLKYPPAPVRVLTLAPSASAARFAAGLVLTGLLFGATVWNNELYDLLDAAWQWGAALLGLSQHKLGPLGVGQLMHHAHSVPAVLLFGLLYVGICGALQGVLLPLASQRRLVGWFYGGACGVALGLLLASQLGGGAAAAELNKQLVHFIVSPLPVIILVPLLRWYLPAPLPTHTMEA